MRRKDYEKGYISCYYCGARIAQPRGAEWKCPHCGMEQPYPPKGARRKQTHGSSTTSTDEV